MTPEQQARQQIDQQLEACGRVAEAGLRPVESRHRVGNRRSRSPADDRAPRLSALHRRQALTKLDDDLPDASKRLDRDVINLPALKKHRVEWTTPDEVTVWLGVRY